MVQFFHFRPVAELGGAHLAEDDCKEWLLSRGDILFSHINSVEHIGKCAVYQGTPAKLVHGMNLLCLRSDTAKLLPDFGIHLIRGKEFRARLSNFINKAVNQASVSISNLKTIPVMVPPLTEQRRIAEILGQAEALRTKRRAALAQLKSLTNSIFFDFFGDPIVNEKDWPRVRLGDQTSKIGSGSTPTGGEKAYKSEGISFIRSLNVRDSEFDFRDLAFIDDTQAAKLSGVVVQIDDVLLNITGASVARVCRAPSSVLPARVNQHVAIIRPKEGLNPVFLEQFLLVPQIKRHLLRIGESGATREAITKGQIELFEIICPPLAVQHEFARRIYVVERLKTVQRTSLAEMDALFASLQHRAFHGQL